MRTPTTNVKFWVIFTNSSPFKWWVLLQNEYEERIEGVCDEKSKLIRGLSECLLEVCD